MQGSEHGHERESKHTEAQAQKNTVKVSVGTWKQPESAKGEQEYKASCPQKCSLPKERMHSELYHVQGKVWQKPSLGY